MIRLPKIFVILLAVIVTCSCQKKSSYTEDQLKAQKVAFFTKRLELTSAEAERFWPVYNEYWNRKNKIIEGKRSAMKYCNSNMGGLSEEELVKYVDLYINFQKQETDLLIEFNEKFKSVLPPAKVLKLYLTDYEFKNYLIHQLKESSKN